MSEIHVSCKDQVLKLTKAPIIASGGVNETKVVFTFCEKWDGFAKTALFYVDADHKYYAILDENNICILPWEVCAENGSFYFTVFGVKEDIRRTASVVKYKVGKGVEVDEMFPSDPTPEVYDQIIALLSENKELTENFISEAGASIEAANEATVNANAIAQDMEEKRDSGYFNGEKGDPGDKDAVLYTEQTLTEAQKTQARENIGAASQAEAAFFHSRLTDGSLVLEDTKTSDSYTLRVTKGKMKLGESTILTNEDEPRILEGAKAGTVLYTQQDLTEDQKASARQNIGAAGLDQVVRTDRSQGLSVIQKARARQNIGAASADSVVQKDTVASVESVKINHSPETNDAIFAEGSIVDDKHSLSVNALTLRGCMEIGAAVDLDSVIIRNVHAGEDPTDAATVGQVVRIDQAQNLSEEQKAQARENIGVTPGGDVNVDLTGYVKDTDYATTDKAGVVKAGMGLSMVNGAIQIEYAKENQITAKNSYRNPITPVNLDLAVKTSVTTNQLPLTAEEQQAAKNWLGVVDGGGGGAEWESYKTITLDEEVTAWTIGGALVNDQETDEFASKKYKEVLVHIAHKAPTSGASTSLLISVNNNAGGQQGKINNVLNSSGSSSVCLHIVRVGESWTKISAGQTGSYAEKSGIVFCPTRSGEGYEYFKKSHINLIRINQAVGAGSVFTIWGRR